MTAAPSTETGPIAGAGAILHPTPPAASSMEQPPPTPASPATLEREAVRRMVTRSMRIGIVVWPSFTLVDAWMCFVAYPTANFALFLGYRVLGELVFYAVLRASLRSTTSARTLRLGQNSSFAAAALLISLMAISLGGVRSPYMHGLSIVALVRAAVVPEPWRRAWPGFAATAAAFPVVMAIGALISPTARAEWLTADALVASVSNYIFVASSAVIGLVTSNIVWQAQQVAYRARRVGRYRLLAPIGKGGMGEVWLAWDLSLQRNVALKLLRAIGDTEPDLVVRFEREALATSQLQSPHVIQIFDYGACDDGLYYIAMEYLNGRDLGTVVQESGPISAPKAMDYMIQACCALEVAHRAGVIHRDIKPQNLFLITAEGGDLIKLLDFGIVRFREPRDRHLTWTGMLVGTPTYLAPELWMGAPADELSDIYSLGVTFYFILTGRLPFAESDRYGRGSLPAIFAHPSPAEQSLEELVRRCLNPDPSQRMTSATVLRGALEGLRPDVTA